MTGSASLLNIPPISFFAFQIEKSEPRGNVTKNRRFIKNSFDVLLLFRFKVGHQMTPNGKPSPKLKIPCANNTCGFDPHHRHKKRTSPACLGEFSFLSAACERVEQHGPALQGERSALRAVAQCAGDTHHRHCKQLEIERFWAIFLFLLSFLYFGVFWEDIDDCIRRGHLTGEIQMCGCWRDSES